MSNIEVLTNQSSSESQTQSVARFDQEQLCAKIFAALYERRQKEVEDFGRIIQGTISSSMSFGPGDPISGPIYSYVTGFKTNEVIPATQTKLWQFGEAANLLILTSTNVATAKIGERKDPTIEEIIEQLRKSILPFSEAVAKRIAYLDSASRDEFPDQAPLSCLSLQNFISFICSVPHLAAPSIVLTHSGNIRAVWTRAKDRHFAIEFSEDDCVKFVIFAPDARRSYRTARVSGISSIDSVLEHVQPYRVLDWILNK